MSSIQAYFKQIPSDSQYFVSLRQDVSLNLSYFVEDAAAGTTSYVSGAAQGTFVTSNTGALNGFDQSGATPLVLFRDMGVTILSSGRTFRAVQLLRQDATNTSGAPASGAGASGWTSSTSGTPGVWKPSNEGIQGNVATNSLAASSFGVFYFETGARGLGLAQGLVRYG